MELENSHEMMECKNDRNQSLLLRASGANARSAPHQHGYELLVVEAFQEATNAQKGGRLVCLSSRDAQIRAPAQGDAPATRATATD